MRRSAAVLLAGWTVIYGCAPKTVAPPIVTTPRHVDFLFPNVPPELASTAAAARHADAWSFLQAGDLRSAERHFTSVLKAEPAFYPSEAGMGYVELARREFKAAAARFDRAVARQPAYAPALVGRGEAELAQGRDADALKSFEAAVAADSSLAAVRQRVDVLRFRQVQGSLAAAQQAAAAGRLPEAHAAYQRAAAASPESAFLYRDLAGIERRMGDLEAAAQHATRATELDPNDARAFALLGEILEARNDREAAARAYETAARLDPSGEIATRVARLREELAIAALPAEYRAIPDSARLTRGELAALIGVRLGGLLQAAQTRPAVLLTDTRAHWAAVWIQAVTRAGVMESYPNHTFQPDAPVRRGDLARAASRLLSTIGARRPAAATEWRAARVTFTDLGPGHLHYPSASVAVAAGVLARLEGDTFQLTRPVTGTDALAAIARLETLAREGPGAPR